MNAICPVCNGLNDEPMVCGIADTYESGRKIGDCQPYSPYMGKDTFAFNNDNLIIGTIAAYICIPVLTATVWQVCTTTYYVINARLAQNLT